MSIIGQLGETDLAEGLAVARLRWDGWRQADGRLAVAPGVDGLRSWLLAADPAAADEVLHALVRIGSPSGGDDQAAVWVVVSALMPGAVTVARRLAGIADVDTLVASQLWFEVRSFPWERLHKVAGNVLANTRAGVVRRGALTRVSTIDRVTSPTDEIPDHLHPAVVTSAEELVDVLEAAAEAGAITAADVDVLLTMVAHASHADGPARGRTGQGLMSNEVLAATAATLGVSASTVRRHARRSISAISAAHAHPTFLVAA